MNTLDVVPRVLVVEDDEPTQHLLRALLRRCGYATDTVTNGRDAISRLQTTTYSAVVLDMMMPEVGGQAVVDFLRTANRRIPVVICSAAGPTAWAGFDPAVVKAIIRKPFDVDQFVATITSVAEPAAERQLRVLIVDDDMRARYVLRSFLDHADVSEVEHGEAAEEAVARLQPDVVLLDLILPGRSGEDILLRLRDGPPMSNVPVIIVTSRVLRDSERATILKHAAAILYKGNLSRETLQAAIDHALSTK